mgnify:CR=1 FL=1
MKKWRNSPKLQNTSADKNLILASLEIGFYDYVNLGNPLIYFFGVKIQIEGSLHVNATFFEWFSNLHFFPGR